MSLKAGEDVWDVQWLTVDPELERRFALMNTAHRELVYLAASRLQVHTYSRLNQCKHKRYPDRFNVFETSVPWATKLRDYSPQDFTDNRVTEISRKHLDSSGGDHDEEKILADPDRVLDRPLNEWASEADCEGHGFHEESVEQIESNPLFKPNFFSIVHSSDRNRSFANELANDRYTYEGPISFQRFDGRPLNPKGRTGLRGRGVLLRWGVNETANCLITRRHPRDERLQFAAVLRHDGSWAIPGNAVRGGKDPLRTARELFDEKIWKAGQTLDCTSKERLKARVEELFADAEQHVLLRGYVDDPRNTDNAWLETTAYHLHCSRELGGLLPLQPELDEEVEPVLKKKAMFSNLLERVGKDDRLDGDDAFVRVGRAEPLYGALAGRSSEGVASCDARGRGALIFLRPGV